MAKPLFAYKHGDLQSGNWTWAVGANANIGDRPLCVATINFHGANAAGYDCEELANMFAKAVPAMTQALDPLVELCPFCNRDPYHYVDIGVGMERAAVNCCDFGVALFKDGDPLAQRVAATITRLTAERDALRGALIDVSASLAAAISLLERGGKAAKKAAPSNKMFDQMLVDYRNSLERARNTLKEISK
jgi:hypothetical protein